MPYSSTSISALTRQIADAIGEACGQMKIQPVDLTHGGFVKWLKNEKGLNAAEMSRIRLHLQRVGGFQNLRNSFFVGSASSALIEREEMKGISKLGKANVVALAHDELFLSRFSEIMEGVSAKLSKTPVPRLGKKPKTGADTQRVVTLMISDTHFGSKLDPRELPFKYDFEEEASALASIMVRLCEFKPDYRDETELIMWLGGDLIRGKIHDKQAGYTGAEQSADAMHLLVQAVRIAAAHYKKVTVYCSTGNHDRDESRHHGSAFEEKFDSKATLIYFGVKLATNHLDNVRVYIPRSAYCTWDVFGHSVYATHGDNNLQVGNPAKGISVGAIDTQMKTLQLSRLNRGMKPYEIFLCGHLHQGLHIPLPAGELIVNPCLIPTDGYAQGIGYSITRPGQTLFESTQEHAVGDLRFLFVPPEVLKDRALNKVIIPFRDF